MARHARGLSRRLTDWTFRSMVMKLTKVWDRISGAEPAAAPKPGAGPRLHSLDALRGFNMFWIIGAERIAHALGALRLSKTALAVEQLSHSQWIGFTFNDLIFPLFIYLVGISLTFSVENRRRRGERTGDLLRHAIIRTGLLFLIGLFMSNSGYFLRGVFDNIRWMGVLQRIALCYGAASFLVLFTKPRQQFLTVCGLLIGYWLLLRFVPVPGAGPGVWTEEGNLANYLDSRFLPGRLYYGTWDPEGLLSTFPAIAACLLGALSGHWLRFEGRLRGKLIDARAKAEYLAAAGLLLAALGLLWGLDFPVIKKIWTSSYILLAAGLSAVLMALFYWLIDIRNWRNWAFPFIVVGLNSIFIYVGSSFLPFDACARWLVGGKAFASLGDWRLLAEALVSFVLQWLLLWAMYQRKIFIRL
ncbi:putative acyltransferase [Hydrogenispora ethanolica]|uniref:Putative acyltransferase n=2 Tax=Hydrogenispora ethanolica TaxID=1082276 RepID=A0A4R1QTJ3_HYDET|nr:putative acyltransferase [Hydrogenispora ethanolica]